MIYILSTIAVLGILVFVHELGHFLAAKSVGIRVDTFSLGFPPKIWGKTVGETEYRIGMVPLGGYVKMAGMIDESFDTEFEEQEAQPHEYRSKKAWQKIYVSSAGVIMNLLLTVIIFFFLTLANGVSEVADEAYVDSVSPEMPAAMAGLQAGDLIVRMDEKAINSWDELTEYIYMRADISVELYYEREGIESHVTITPVSQRTVRDGDIVTVGMIGIGGKLLHHDASISEAFIGGFVSTWYWLKLTWNSMAMLVSGEESL
ncbi:MAG: site-2 protease family protein, partial [Candidatus Marinimicrobia bacterium]|nr:site-2 protease family protein [Candidatus Neomarinimicrobiota bacterium]